MHRTRSSLALTASHSRHRESQSLLLATIGLRGISRQFGQLGGASTVGDGAASANPTLVDMTRSTKPSAVDWDDEF